jgi:hypothetical protein
LVRENLVVVPGKIEERLPGVGGTGYETSGSDGGECLLFPRVTPRHSVYEIRIDLKWLASCCACPRVCWSVVRPEVARACSGCRIRGSQGSVVRDRLNLRELGDNSDKRPRELREVTLEGTHWARV